ncbi:histidine phosphotransferase family protein [Szabonella alba]|uniref:Histidine phosphotransferase n=1 Tax=Szabonella alba TaxID=2804194 RepID=A0A8K0Y2G5_9RHOB|nr:histidine phosphotransferase family protein [Szabonella alba]MBL4917524.1 histidine phosphotransferase [Szabonella alba]
MTERPDLTALLGSRICHDLISPIGAIGNGIELMLMEGAELSGPEVALISESAASANARIRFFRVAFGQASHDQRLGAAEIRSILANLSSAARITTDWQIAQNLPRAEVKLGFLALMCLETAMAFGGRTSVTFDGGRLVVTGQAARLKIDPGTWNILTPGSGGAGVTPPVVHFALLREEVTRLSRLIAVDLRETEIKMVV